VQPEVSEPDYAHGVQLFGFQVPAFVTRRAETQVRLRDNQTLIVAGLILHEKKEIVQKVPYLGDVPYLGGLFRNTEWDDTETDLVMSVTPEIVRPLPPSGQVYLPTSRPPMTEAEIKTERLATPNVARPRF
jgi:pilus assembly protein CpaC